MKQQVMQTIGRRVGADPAVVLAGMAVLALLTAGPVTGQTPPPPPPDDLAGCSADVWAEYNDCLMSAGSRFERYLCDADFLLESAECVAEEVGELRRAITG